MIVHKIRQENNISARRLVTAILWSVGDCIPYYRHKRMFHVVKIYSICALLFQIFMAILNIWGGSYYLCCHEVADPAVLLRFLYPYIIEMNALIYQMIFLLKISKIKRLLNELDRVVPHKATSTGYWRAAVTSFFLAFFSLSLLGFARISACGILDNYYLTYNLEPLFCDQIYVITKVKIVSNALFTGTYTKMIMQVISIWLAIIGVVFTELWIGNILHSLATAFEESHDNLMHILKEEFKEERLQPVSQKFQQETQFPKLSKSFQIWRKRHYQLRISTQRADSVLSSFALLHTLFTPILLCLAGFQLLQKNQEPFMRLIKIKLVCYYLICLCVLRMWLVCNAGEQLATQVMRFIFMFSRIFRKRHFSICNNYRISMRKFFQVNSKKICIQRLSRIKTNF